MIGHGAREGPVAFLRLILRPTFLVGQFADARPALVHSLTGVLLSQVPCEER